MSGMIDLSVFNGLAGIALSEFADKPTTLTPLVQPFSAPSMIFVTISTSGTPPRLKSTSE